MGIGQKSIGLRLGGWLAGMTKVALGLAVAGALLLPGCKDEPCDGVEVNGECQAKCDQAVCAAKGLTCVNNSCRKSCTAQTDCPLGYYCYQLDPNDPAKGSFCDFASFALNDGGIGIDEPCSKDEECDAVRGYTCVSGECRLVGCTQHADCKGIGLCEAGTDVAGNPVLACKKGDTYPDGQFGTSCPAGPSGTECDDANGFVCVGAGPGDVDAYCTKTGCLADADCGAGYFCATVRTSRVPCADTCNIKGSSTTPNCVPVADIGSGKEFSCGPLSLLRNMCLKRDYCTSCETDEDCRGLPGQVCAKDIGGKKICTVVCDPGVSNACPWGNASLCAVHDKDLNVPTCAHRFGSCQGTGKGCEPCVDDGDCPSGICYTSDFTREQFCVDLGPSCSCAGLPTEQNVYCKGGGCPLTPGNVTMECYGGSDIQSTSWIYNKCLGANVQTELGGSPQTGCWLPLN